MTEHGASRRSDVMDAISGHIEETGYAPTIREIQESTGIASSSTVSYHLQALRIDGLIEYTPGLSRSIRLPNQKHSELKTLVYSSKSDKRIRIMEYIDWYWTSYGCGPSYQDISSNVQIVKSGVSHHLVRLRKSGLVDKVDGKFRSVRLTDLGREQINGKTP